MQSEEQVKTFTQHKIHSVTNKKVIHDMQLALQHIEKEEHINSRHAIFGLTIILPICLYIAYSFYF